MTVAITAFTTFRDTQLYQRNAFVFGAADQYLDGFLESYSRKYDVILTVLVTSGDSVLIYYINSNGRRNDARRREQLYGVGCVALRTTVRNSYNG